MKHMLRLAALLLMVQFGISCKKVVDATNGIALPLPAGIIANTKPTAFAGVDLFIDLPNNSVNLNGNALDKENNIKEYGWEKISGPDFFTFDDKRALNTKVTDLVKGVYGFELTVKDSMGLSSKDTVMVTVRDPANQNSNQINSVRAYAGMDVMLETPGSETYLNGSFSFTGSITVSATTWFQINGPSMCTIENKNLLRTKVSGLEKGFYQFELSIVNSSGIRAKDTVDIVVGKLPDNAREIIFNNVKWISPWYYCLEIKDFRTIVPHGTFFKIYVQRSNNIQWIEVPALLDSNSNATYEYFIEQRPDGAGMYHFGSLYIFYYGSDVGDRPSIKIMF